MLYSASGLLWPDKPGRMVRLASEIHSAGNGLDLGCGDGKNLVYLENRGWKIDGIDISNIAIKGAWKRIRLSELKFKGRLRCEDVTKARFEREAYDLIIAYGLYHCLPSDQLWQTHKQLSGLARRGGLLAFATLDDGLPIPQNHFTGQLYLRSREFILSTMSDWEPIIIEYGLIKEAHPPLVPRHKHSVTWGLLAKR